MKLTIILFFFFQLSTSLCQSKLIKFDLKDPNPGNLEAFIFVPKKDTNLLLPLVIALHGCNQSAENMAEASGWNKLAELHNFAVLYPQQKLINNGNLCFNWFLEKDNMAGSGEIESIRQMIEKALSDYSIDSNRIYVTGLSAGAAMSVALLANYPNLFVAGASLAGCAYGIVEQKPGRAVKAMRGKLNLTQDELKQYVDTLHVSKPTNYPRLIILQGEKDLVVNKKNAALLILQWTGLHKLDTISDSVELNFSGNSKIERIEYWDNEKQSQIIYYKIADLGHALPINPGESSDQGGKTGIFTVDIDFHSTYQIAKDFDLIK